MEQNDFLNILRKYRRGDASPEEKKLVDEWYASMGKVVDHHVPGEAELNHLYQSTIYPHVKNSRKDKLEKLVRWYSVGIAASILVTVITYFIVIDYTDADNRVADKKETSTYYWKIVANTTQMTQVIVLPDSSNVSLEPESKLKFSSVFNNTEREVYLEGEAFFDVTHNASLPFFVHANEVTTKVLGTSFIIKARESEQKITVMVKTGKVSVYTKQEKKQKSSSVSEIILTPNQQVVFDKKEKEISKMLVKSPQVILPEEEIRLMRFEEAPVTEIFKALEKAYGVDIEFDEAIFSSCELTTVVADDDIYSRLDIICNTIGCSYTLREDRIVMKGTGCTPKQTR